MATSSIIQRRTNEQALDFGINFWVKTAPNFAEMNIFSVPISEYRGWEDE